MNQPSLLLWLALIAFVPATVILFATLRPRSAVLASLLGGWLLLPQFDRAVGASIPLLHTKAMLVPAVVLCASLVFHARAWRSMRASWLDLPAAVYCALPYFSATMNDLGGYEGLSAVLEAVTSVGAPYLLGRAHFADEEGVRELAVGVTTAALAYVPLVLWEVRMSPQIHREVYGYHQHSFAQVIRGGGFRPMVFLQHGLMLAFFLAMATLLAYWMWRTRAVNRILGIRVAWVALVLAVTVVLCKSTGAAALLAVGVLALEATRTLRTTVVLLSLAALPPVYCLARASGASADPLVDLAARNFGADRAFSLRVRIINEDRYVSRALAGSAFGWGRAGGLRVRDAHGDDDTIMDGLWIIQLGIGGVGWLAAFGALVLAPLPLLARRLRRRRWRDARLAPALAWSVVLGLWAIDCLLNAMMNPAFVCAAGALVSAATSRVPARPAPVPIRGAARRMPVGPHAPHPGEGAHVR